MTACRFTAIPDRMRGRPIDHRGFPVPWFVTAKDEEGHWDFIHISSRRLMEAHRKNLCMVSGQPLGKFVSFCLGPMCVINRITVEPPCIPEIAHWAAQVCPFMSHPLAKRPPDTNAFGVPGVMVEDNPGGVVVWTVRRGDYRLDREGIFHVGDPTTVTWYHKGREATHEEALDIYTKRAAKLREIAVAEGDGAVEDFERRKQIAERYVP